MPGKDSSRDFDKTGFSVAEKKSMPNLDGTDRTRACNQPPKRKSRHLYKYQTPSFSAVSRGLETEPPAFPPLDLIPFDGQNNAGAQGDTSTVAVQSAEAAAAAAAATSVAAAAAAAVAPSPRPEFKMVREDFPALPGTQNNESFEYGYQLAGGESTTSCHRGRPRSTGIETRADGRVSNIPRSMVQDQYGISGLLSFLRAAECDKTLEVQGLGEDLTTYGFDLNTKEVIHPNFSGPFADFPAQPHDLDYDVPKEYLHHRKTKKKLPAVDFSRYNDDTLFYLFYTFVGDYKQLMAAAYLYDKEWRFHTEENYWMSLLVDQKNSYCFFDPSKWCKVRVIDYEIDIQKLAARPHVPNVSPPMRQDPRNAASSLSPAQTVTVPAVQQQMHGTQQPLQVVSMPVRPAYPFLGACTTSQTNNFSTRHNIATVYTPCTAIIGAVTPRNAIPVVPSRALPVMSPSYSRYNVHASYTPPRNITTLYAPAPIYSSNSDATELLRRKKRR